MINSRLLLVLLLASAGAIAGCSSTPPGMVVHQRITKTKGERLDGSRLTGERVDIAPLLPLMLGAKPVDSWVLWADQFSVRLDDGTIVNFARKDGARFRLGGSDATLEVDAASAERFQELVRSVFAAATPAPADAGR